MNGASCDAFVRDGFRFAAFADHGWIREAIGQSSIVRYDLGRGIATIRERLAAGDSRFVLFADAAVQLPARPMRRALQFLAQTPSIPGVTLGSAAIGLIYGAPKAAGRIAQTVAPVSALPSWLAVVRRDALDPTDPTSGYETIEFLLLDLGARRKASAKPFHHIGTADLQLDPQSWAKDLMVTNWEMLANDYERFLQRHGPAAVERVPPQFRVEMVGRYIDPPPIDPSHPAAPTISVICPVFKSEFVERMIESVKWQTWPHWELLMIVDGPPAADAARIKQIFERVCGDPRILYSWQANRGTGPTRHRLGEIASGDFVLSIDDDDELLPEALETFAAGIVAEPGVAVFRGGARLIGLVSCDLEPRPRLLVNGITNDSFEVTQPYAISRGALQRIGGFEWDPSLRSAGEDTYLFHKIDRARMPTRIVNRTLYLRRLSTKNLTLGFRDDEAYAHAQNIDRLFCPPDWRMIDCQQELLDGFQRSTSIYRHRADSRQVICTTKFFQYRTLGTVAQTTIDLELTSVCNAVCTFCPREVMPDKTTFMPIVLVQRLADQLRRMKKPPQVVFCGIGESTLHPDLEAATRLVVASGAPVAMTTNGARLTGDLFRRLAQAGMGSVNVSLNAFTAETHRAVMKMNTFEKTLANLDEVLGMKLRTFPDVLVHVSFVVCEQNEHEVASFVEHWRHKGVSRIWLHPVNNRAGLIAESAKPVELEKYAWMFEKDPLVLVDILRDRPEADDLCKVARSFLFISAEGEMRLCAMDYKRQTRYGNIGTHNLEEMHFYKLISFTSGETMGVCANCDFFPAAARPALAPARMEVAG